MKLSKAQHRALKELAKGVTTFGPGFSCLYTTGKRLVEQGLAQSIDDRQYNSSTAKRRRPYLKARITDEGRAALKNQ